MAATTAAAIRQTIITKIAAITPVSSVGDKFRLHRSEQPVDVFGDENPDAVFRLFTVFDTGRYIQPEVSGLDVESRRAQFRILVGYPMTYRIGKNNSRSIDDIIDQDADLIDAAVGLRGFGNFADSVMIAGEWTRAVVDGENTRYLQFELTHEFWRNLTNVPI